MFISYIIIIGRKFSRKYGMERDVGMFDCIHYLLWFDRIRIEGFVRPSSLWKPSRLRKDTYLVTLESMKFYSPDAVCKAGEIGGPE